MPRAKPVGMSVWFDIFMHYRQMKPHQEKTYMHLRDAGYEFCQNEDNGDVIVAKYERTSETSRMIYAIAIHEDGRYAELDLSNNVI